MDRLGRWAAEIGARLDAWEDELCAVAEDAARDYTAAMYASRDGRAPKDWYRYAVRVRRRRGGVEIEWRRMQWGQRGGKTTYRATNIRKGPGDRYPQSRFAPVSEDEANLIATREDIYREVRRELRIIGVVRKTLSAYQRRTAEDT